MLAHHLDGEPALQRAAGAERVSHVALLRADRHPAAEQARGGLGFGDVAVFGGGAVAVDVADGRGRDAGIGQRQLHAGEHGVSLGAGDVRAVAVAAIAEHLGQDAGTAGAGMVEGFEHQHARPLAHHQSVAVLVIGRGCALRRVVLLAGGVEGVEDVSLGGAEFLTAAGQHHVDHPVLDRLIGVADALAAGGAGTGGGDDATGQSEEDGHVGRGGVRHHPHIGVGVEAGRDAVEQQAAQVGHVGGAAGGRAAGHAHPAIADGRVIAQAGIGQRRLGSRHAQA